jgi:hypothetical protein
VEMNQASVPLKSLDCCLIACSNWIISRSNKTNCSVTMHVYSIMVRVEAPTDFCPDGDPTFQIFLMRI